MTNTPSLIQFQRYYEGNHGGGTPADFTDESPVFTRSDLYNSFIAGMNAVLDEEEE